MEWSTHKYRYHTVHWVSGPSPSNWYVLEADGKFFVRKQYTKSDLDMECPTLEAAKVAVAMLAV